MKYNKVRLILLWLLPVLWASIIYNLSDRPALHASGVFLIQFVLAKIFHLFEYAVLSVLLYRAFAASFRTQKTPVFLLAFVYSLCYAAFDELHQLYIISREGRIRDIGIDAIGIILGLWLIKKFVTVHTS